eukprot:s4721_g3.t1
MAAQDFSPISPEKLALSQVDRHIAEMCKDEAAAKHAEDWKIFSHWCSTAVKQEISQQRISGGESMEEVRLRAVQCLEEADPGPERVVIEVTHGGVLGQLLRHAVQNSGQQVPKPGNACISRFLVRPGGPWEVVDWALTHHLEGDLAPAAADYGR